jgi:predicted ArsR family transcriptional regulator
VLDYVRTHAPVRIAALAAGLDLHANTVRGHLDALLEYHLVERITEAPAGRGRPAALYRPTAVDPAVVSQDYAGLATALAGHLARTSATPERDGRTAGVEWGRELVAEATAGDDPRRTVLDVLSRLGFAPDGDIAAAEGIALRACPLLDAARRYPTIVCQVHLGIIEGILERIGAVIDGDLELIPFAEPGACRLFLPNPVVRQASPS